MFNPLAGQIPVKNLIVPDVLSSHPVSKEDDTGLYEDVQTYVDAIEEYERCKIVLERIKTESGKGESLLIVKHYIKTGWPQYENSLAKTCCLLV